MPSTKGPRGEGHCSFCGKSQSQARRLVAGPGRVFICEECILTCQGLLQEEGAPQARSVQQPAPPQQIPPPKVIYRQVSEYVIGQERAKKILSVAVYNHYKRSFLGKDKFKEDVEMQKSNILLIGPTGSGKTLLAQTLAKILDVPFSISDATSLTEAGYVGEDVENILLRLIQAADYNLPRAEAGIIYIDEIDKLARKGPNPSITRDVSGEGVQQALLKIVEGCVANVPPQGGRKHPYQDFIQINTEHILFICGGSFEGLEKIVEKRTSKDRQSMGFTARLVHGISKGSPPILQHVTPDDLLEYGFIPELVGRLPVTAALNPLDKATLIDVLTVPKNSIVKQFQRLFAMDGVELVFTDGALEEAAEEALKIKTGARGLRSIIEEILLDVMYELPSLKDAKKCVVEAETIAGRKSPVLFTASGGEIYLEGTQERSA